MAEIYFLLLVCLIIWYFAFSRKVAERARGLAEQHCQQNGLQFIAIARSKTSVGSNKQDGVFIRFIFDFEFSGDGESSYIGKLTMNGIKVGGFELPAYKI